MVSYNLKMVKLNLPEYQFITRVSSVGKREIFDEIRRKYIVLTPEEWVRQNFLRYLKEEKGYPSMLMAIEKGITVVGMKKRFDAVVYDRQGMPFVLIEFKSAEIKIDQKVMEQISRYNLSLKVPYLIVSNGLTHYCCFINNSTAEILFLKEIPKFEDFTLHR